MNWKYFIQELSMLADKVTDLAKKSQFTLKNLEGLGINVDEKQSEEVNWGCV